MWNPFSKKTAKVIKNNINNIIESDEQRLERSIIEDNVDLAVSLIYKNNNENINYNSLFKKLYANHSINIFTYIIKNTKMTTSIQNNYAFFLCDILSDDFESSQEFYKIAFLYNWKVTGQNSKNGTIHSSFSHSFFEACIEYKKPEMFRFLMTLNFKFKLKTTDIFEKARTKNKDFLDILFEYPKLTQQFIKENTKLIKQHDIYQQYILSSKIDNF